ncbi:transposase [Helicobacter felistomachi]|uniref:transposase n=1 Tax=Helicobacter felistomachi TaxID=3040201 RepID=UPI00257406DE|nr:transposase [Helicobacter sp. NHP21005]
MHRKIKNLRTDFFYKLANSLARQYATIFIEDLNLKGMVKLWGCASRRVARLMPNCEDCYNARAIL